MFKSKQKLLAKVIVTAVSFLYVTSIFSLLFLTPSTSETALAQIGNPADFEPPTQGFVPRFPAPPSQTRGAEPFRVQNANVDGDVDDNSVVGNEGGTVTVGSTETWETIVYSFAIVLFGWIVGITGWFFDSALDLFIMNFGVIYKTWGVGVAVENTWGIVRDVFNLTFIFGIIYIGFRMILNSDDSSAKRTLVTLLAAALLVNFSLFITKFVIDFSNILAAEIFKAIKGDVSTATSFINYLKLSSINQTEVTAPGGVGIGMLFLLIFGTIILYLITAFVFLSGAVMITIRFIALLVYMIFSPIMFLGWVFPNMAGHSKKFFQDFLKRAFFAPAYLFMLYLSFNIISTFYIRIKDSSDLSNLFTQQNVENQSSDVSSVIVYFALSCGLMIASLVVAQKMGAHGADTAISIGQKARKSAQGMMYRNTVGAGLHYGGVKVMDALDRGAESESRGKRWASKITRGTLGGESTRRALEKGANYGAGGYGRADVEKMNKERKARATGKIAEMGLSDALSNWSNNKTDPDANIKLEQTIQKASNSSLIDTLRDHKSGSDEYKRVAQAMSHAQINKLLESKEDEFTSTEKEVLRAQRAIQVADKISSGSDLETGVSKASVDDLVSLGYQKLFDYAFYIPGTKMDDLRSKMTTTEFKLLEAERDRQIGIAFGNNVTRSMVFNQPNSTSRKKDSEIAKLPSSILKDSRSLPYLNARILDIILRENYLNDGDRGTIRTNITTTLPLTNPLHEWLINNPAGKTF